MTDQIVLPERSRLRRYINEHTQFMRIAPNIDTFDTFEQTLRVLNCIYLHEGMTTRKGLLVRCTDELKEILKVDFFLKNSPFYFNKVLKFFRPVELAVDVE
jgi:hypothetical protein